MSETPNEAVPNRESASSGDWAEAAEARVLDAALRLAGETGWTRRLVDRAARAAGLSAGEGELLLPHGPRDLAALAARRHLARTFDRLAAIDPAVLKIRERIRVAVQAKVDATWEDGPEALRAQAGFLLLHAPLALRLFWEAADAIWRWAGDVATDENHYSKRAILVGVLASTLAVRMSSGDAAARAHLDARIENVMAFERFKARVRPGPLGHELVGALARLRYGRR
jgi:ubiquinone biosynthesis protein COQ9